MESIGSITPTATFLFQGPCGIHLRAKTEDFFLEANLVLNVQGQGYAHMHMPTLRSVLKRAPPRLFDLSLERTDQGTVVSWGTQKHFMPHLNLASSLPPVIEFHPYSVYRCEDPTELIKFCKEIHEDIIKLVGTKEKLTIVTNSDLCDSTYELPMCDEKYPFIYNDMALLNRQVECTVTIPTKLITTTTKITTFADRAFLAISKDCLLLHYEHEYGNISITN